MQVGQQIRAKPWKNPERPPKDLAAEEKEVLQEKTSNSKPDGISTGPIYKSFMEEVVLQRLFVGMKIEATIHKLNCGIWFSDEVLRAFRSFNTYLCNELMACWKEPRAVDSAAAKLSDRSD